MAEMRQRKGKTTDVATKSDADKMPDDLPSMVKTLQDTMRGAMEEKVRKEAEKGTSETEIQEKITAELTKMFSAKPKPLPGVNNQTNEVRLALKSDPYNLELIYKLGLAYMLEEKFTEAANVMVRGWKRMSEFEDPGARLLFLLNLCMASLEDGKSKQALAVLMDIEEPEAGSDANQEYHRIACKVYASNDNLQKSLKAFSTCIEGKDFDNALTVYLNSITHLKKIGAYDAAKSMMEKLAKDDTDLNKMKISETVHTLKSAIQENSEPPNTRTMKMVVGATVTLAFIAMLYSFESQSLAKMKIGPGT